MNNIWNKLINKIGFTSKGSTKTSVKRTGCIYIAKSGDSEFLKIGSIMGSNIDRRMRELSVSTVEDFFWVAALKDIINPYTVEHNIHKLLSLHQLKNSQGKKKELFRLGLNEAKNFLKDFAQKNGHEYIENANYKKFKKRHNSVKSLNTIKVIRNIKTNKEKEFKTWKDVGDFLGITWQSAQEGWMEGRLLKKIWKPVVKKN